MFASMPSRDCTCCFRSCRQQQPRSHEHVIHCDATSSTGIITTSPKKCSSGACHGRSMSHTNKRPTLFWMASTGWDTSASCLSALRPCRSASWGTTSTGRAEAASCGVANAECLRMRGRSPFCAGKELQSRHNMESPVPSSWRTVSAALFVVLRLP